ncbi:MAG: TonB-dependent receptor [Geobacteraceae bacterium]|nr:TonB-dependent receptor [Geobacteraceae bacterium]
MNIFISVLAGTVLIVSGSLPALAETVLDEITVRGSREPAQEESLSVREIRESPARDMGEAIRSIEGVSSVRKGAIANDPVIRGFQKDNINVLIDGMRIHGACPSRMDPPSFHVDFAEVDKVRVVKGPYDLGNPGSMGGMIDVTTRRPRQGWGGDLSLTYGSWDTVNASAIGSYGGDRFDALLGYAYKYSGVPESGDGKRITDVYPATSPNRYRSNAIDSHAYEINTGWLKFGYKPTANSRTELAYSYQDADHVLYPYLKMDADYDRTNRLNWNYSVKNISDTIREVKLQAYWDRIGHLMDDRLRMSSTASMMVTRPYSMQTDARTEVIGGKAATTIKLAGGEFSGGMDYYTRNWNALNQRAMYTAAVPYSTLNMIPDVYADNLGVYGEYEYPLAETVRLRGGLRGDFTWIKADNGNPLVTAGTSTDFQNVSANLQLTYTPVKGLDLFLGFGRGTRTPDPEELYIIVPAAPPAVTWKGNPDLKSTVNHQADLGMKFSAERYYVSASFFYSDLTDYVNFYSPSATSKSYQNIHARMWGGELGSQISLPLDIYLKGALSYTQGENLTDDRPLSEIPPLRGLVAVRYDNGTYFGELTENLTREQDRVDGGLNEAKTAGWATTDIKFGYSYRALSLYAGVNNLFDQYYVSHLSYLRDPFSAGVGVKVPENGRNFYLTATYRF